MAGNSPITLNSVACQAGDRLVVEVGYAKNCTSLEGFAAFRYGDLSSIDLPEDFTTTNDNNPWIQFSQTIAILNDTYVYYTPSAVYYYVDGALVMTEDNT